MPFRTSQVIWRVNLHLERLILSGILTVEQWKGVLFQHPLLAGRRPKRKTVRASKVTWLRPQTNWIKVHTDGAFSSPRNEAGVGGLFRNSEGKLIAAFSACIQASSSLETELKAIEMGITTTVRWGNIVWIETDAATIVHLLSKDEHGPAPLRHLVGHIRHKIYQLNWKISYIAREGNKPADFLAARGIDAQGHLCFDNESAPVRTRQAFRTSVSNRTGPRTDAW